MRTDRLFTLGFMTLSCIAGFFAGFFAGLAAAFVPVLPACVGALGLLAVFVALLAALFTVFVVVFFLASFCSSHSLANLSKGSWRRGPATVSRATVRQAPGWRRPDAARRYCSRRAPRGCCAPPSVRRHG